MGPCQENYGVLLRFLRVFSAKSAQKKMPLENKFSQHFFFAYVRKKERKSAKQMADKTAKLRSEESFMNPAGAKPRSI
jgi:hypothetical protein